MRDCRAFFVTGVRNSVIGAPGGQGSAATNVSSWASVTISGGASRSTCGRGALITKPASSAASATAGAIGSASTMPRSSPLPRTAVTWGWSSARISAASRSPAAVARSSRPSRSMIPITARPAAAATGLPPKVVPCEPGPSRDAGRTGGDAGADREPVAQPLGEGDDVGGDAGGGAGQPGPAPSDAGLHLVDPEQCTDGCGQLAGGAQVVRRWLDDAVLALDRFEDHRCHRVVQHGGEGFDVAVGHERDIARAAARTAPGRQGWLSARAHRGCGRGRRPPWRSGGSGRCGG